MESAVTPWSNDKTLSFITSVCSHPEIWDPAHDKYRDRHVKRKIWNKIASEFSLTAETAQNKFKSLRTYAKAEAKRVQAKRERRGESVPVESSWFAHSAMSFIMNTDGPDRSVDATETCTAPQEEHDGETETELREEAARSRQEDEQAALQQAAVQQPQQQQSQPRKKTRARKRHRDHQQLQEPYDCLREGAAGNTDNMYSNFGSYVATKLNCYQPRLASLVEYRISQILYEADMVHHDHRQQVSSCGPSHTPSPDPPPRRLSPSPSPELRHLYPSVEVSGGTADLLLSPPARASLQDSQQGDINSPQNRIASSLKEEYDE